MMFILFIILLVDKSQSLEWNCTENKHNHHLSEQCTITIEYLSFKQERQVCITHTLLIKNLPLLSYSSNYSMKTFKINSCQLLTLSQIPFTLPSSLEILDLSYNLLSTFTLSYPLPSYLKYLYLDHNPNLIHMNFGHSHIQQQLIGVSLKHNKHLQISSLPYFLKYLDLTDCNLYQSPILSLLKSLTNLTYLSLANNQLKQLPILNDNIQLEYFNLSNNHLKSIEDRSLYKYLKSNHSILQLSLQGNPLVCDCWLGSMIDSSFINITDLSSVQCNSHSIVDIPPDDLLCSYTRHCALDCSCCDFEACDCHSICPSECLCSHDVLWSQHIVKCREGNLSDIHIFLPETITELNYEDNSIEQLKPFIFVGKTKLIKLNLSKNNIRLLTNETFCAATNLEEINLSYNPNLISIISNLNYLFDCLKNLKYIILSKEQIKNNEQISYGWIMTSNNDFIQLIRIQQQQQEISSLNTTIDLIETESSTIYPTYHKESFTYSNIIQNNQTLLIIVFFLLLFVLLFLILLISLAICRRKLRRHLTTELQRQRSHHYYYHHNQPSIKIPDNNGLLGVNESLYEQLPSLSSDSEQPFLYNEKNNPPALPPYPPTFRHYHCCHTTNSHEYQCPTVLVLGNQLIYPNHHDCSSEIQPCLLSNQQENNKIHYCNKETVLLPTTICRCNGHKQNTDIYISSNAHR